MLFLCSLWFDVLFGLFFICFVYFVASFLVLFNIIAFVAYNFFFNCLILSNWKVMIL